MKYRFLVAVLVLVIVIPAVNWAAASEPATVEFCGVSLDVPDGWMSWTNCQEVGGMVAGGVDDGLVSLMPTIEPGFRADFEAAYSGFDENIVAAVINPQVGSDKVVTHMVAIWFPLDLALAYAGLAADDYRGFFEYMNSEPTVSGDIWFAMGEEFANGIVLETGMYLIPARNAFVAVEGQVGFGNASDYDTLKAVMESLSVAGAETVEPENSIPFGGHPAGLNPTAVPMFTAQTMVTDLNTADSPAYDENVFGATGDYQLTDFGDNCTGYVSAIPSYGFEVDTSATMVAVTAASSFGDIGLLIQTPNGSFLCVDDGLFLEGYPPEQEDVLLDPTIGNLGDVSGVYRVWITTPEPNTGFAALVAMAVME